VKLRVANILVAAGTCLLLSGCSSEKPKGPEIEYYQAAYRQLPPEPVYGRLMWSNLPAPIHPRARETAPLLMPTMAFEFPRSNLGDTIQALAQAIGYTWSCPNDVAKRPIAIKMTAPVDQILREISRQGQVYGVLDHEQRVVRVVSKSMISPELKQARLPGSSS
jgi:hypothetical protein